MSRLRRIALGVLVVGGLGARNLSAQTVTIGYRISYLGNVNPPDVETIVDFVNPANLDGMVTTATFGWSMSPCPAAAKIKFFRPQGRFETFPDYVFIAERGPFGVDQPLRVPGPTVDAPVIQTVSLDPPVPIRQGDVIAITNLTTCGGPVYHLPTVVIDGGVPYSFAVPGDVTGTLPSGQTRSRDRGVFVTATGPSPALALLRGRFAITLDAVDPRTHTAAVGVPTKLGDGAGYFSLPAFTGDPTFPEVTVKMADATSLPALGGQFWFFYAPLTDVEYTLAVRDQVNGTIRTYGNSPGNPGQLCGGVDTSAFPP